MSYQKTKEPESTEEQDSAKAAAESPEASDNVDGFAGISIVSSIHVHPR